jgi:hypothetical protein
MQSREEGCVRQSLSLDPQPVALSLLRQLCHTLSMEASSRLPIENLHFAIHNLQCLYPLAPRPRLRRQLNLTLVSTIESGC